MAVPVWSATVGGNNVPGIQSVAIRQGQANISDQSRSGSLTMSGREPENLPAIAIEDTISVTLTFGANTRTFSFRVADLAVEYGISQKYDSWTITGEDAFAVLGRAAVDISWSSGKGASAAASDLCALVGVTFGEALGMISTATCNAQTISDGNALDILNTLLNTEQGRATADATNLRWQARNWNSLSGVVYASDDGTGTQPVKYDSLAFTSLADNLADFAVVSVRNGNTVTTGSGVYSIGFDTYSVNDTDATYAGQFKLAQLDVDTPVPTRISYKIAPQTTTGWSSWDLYKKAVIKFRSTTYEAFVIGVNYTGTVDETRVTWDLAASSYYEFLILNDAFFGTLNNNRLGW